MMAEQSMSWSERVCVADIAACRYENETDVQAIKEAEQNMGDYKLKSDHNYVIPEVS